MNYILNILQKKDYYKKPPIWIMRQAGRYLPEYRKIRNSADSFLDICYNPKLACEITLQPIKRFDFDAAIIFSDILVIPNALGCDLKFDKGIGPKLSKISSSDDLKALKIDNINGFLKPVFEAVSLARQKLDKNKSLIGFSGCPWTLACYMIEGGGSKNFDNIRRLAIEDKVFFRELMNILTNSIIKYLELKIEAGCDILKLFDSWAGIVPNCQIEEYIINPTIKIVDYFKEKYPNIPIICFPKSIGFNYLKFSEKVNCDAIAFDQNIPLNWIRDNFQNRDIVAQGNLDNFILAFGSKDDISKRVDNIINIIGKKPFIFNLGHGILPQTPIENVEFLVDKIRS